MLTLIPTAMLIWHVRISGSWSAFFGSWLLTMISALSIRMMVGGIAKNAKSASVIACILYFPMLIFSGATLPFEVMPAAMQKIVRIFPMTQGIQLMKSAFLGLPVEHVYRVSLLPIKNGRLPTAFLSYSIPFCLTDIAPHIQAVIPSPNTRHCGNAGDFFATGSYLLSFQHPFCLHILYDVCHYIFFTLCMQYFIIRNHIVL